MGLLSRRRPILAVGIMLLLSVHAASDAVDVGDVASAGSVASETTAPPPVTTTPAPPVTTTPAPPVTTTPAPPVTTTPAPPVTTTPAPPQTTTPAPPPPATTTATPPVTTTATPSTTAPAEAGVPPETSAPTTTSPPSTTATPSSTTKAPTATTKITPASTTQAGSTGGLQSSDQGRSADNDSSSNGSSDGGKYAIVIAVVVVVAVVLVAAIYVLRRHRARKDETATELRRQLDQLDMELGESAYALAKASDDIVAGNGQAPHSNNGQGYHSGSGGGSRGSRSSFPFPKLAQSPASWSSSRTTAVSSGERDSLSSAWRDPEILAARIPYEKLEFHELLSRGGFGEVFRGVYHNEPVAIKRLLAENRKRMAALEDFLKEAQLLAMIEHERITAFIGVAWDSPRDLCIVLEFMPNGDLRNLLSEWREEGRKTGWGDVRKVRIALHVAEALTYLHTLSPKVVHRDLKSKNILLDAQWQAKLSDFGVSREESSHNTMTTNVGSSLWIAPEVMMGNNYDEKADIFSFGVVLTELDSHQLPYHNAMTPDGRKMPDAAVLHLVTMGKLQAEFGSMSRTDIVLLGRSCLALDPKQRPSAADLRFRLSQILGSY